jgi:hypothetical protein
MLQDLSAVAVEGGIVSTISKIQEIFGYKFLFTSSNISYDEAVDIMLPF